MNHIAKAQSTTVTHFWADASSVARAVDSGPAAGSVRGDGPLEISDACAAATCGQASKSIPGSKFHPHHRCAGVLTAPSEGTCSHCHCNGTCTGSLCPSPANGIADRPTTATRAHWQPRNPGRMTPRIERLSVGLGSVTAASLNPVAPCGPCGPQAAGAPPFAGTSGEGEVTLDGALFAVWPHVPGQIAASLG